MAVTQRTLAETISELNKVARDLRDAADGEPLTGTKGRIVPANAKGLRAYSDFLDRVATELLQLIDDEVDVTVDLGRELPQQPVGGVR